MSKYELVSVSDKVRFAPSPIERERNNTKGERVRETAGENEVMQAAIHGAVDRERAYITARFAPEDDARVIHDLVTILDCCGVKKCLKNS